MPRSAGWFQRRWNHLSRTGIPEQTVGAGDLTPGAVHPIRQGVRPLKEPLSHSCRVNSGQAWQPGKPADG